MGVSCFDCMRCYPNLCRCPQPKGSMCMSCAKAEADCSGLDFTTMPVIERYQDGTPAVRCTDYQAAADRRAKRNAKHKGE